MFYRAWPLGPINFPSPGPPDSIQEMLQKTLRAPATPTPRKTAPWAARILRRSLLDVAGLYLLLAERSRGGRQPTTKPLGAGSGSRTVGLKQIAQSRFLSASNRGIETEIGGGGGILSMVYLFFVRVPFLGLFFSTAVSEHFQEGCL